MVQWPSGRRQDGNGPVTLQTMCGCTVARARRKLFLLAKCPWTKQCLISIPYDFFRALPRPDVGKIINEVVANDPPILTKALEIQLLKLILEPLQQVSEELKQPIVIIIDGLDECEGEDVQSNVLRLLGSVFPHPSVGRCDRICFIVASRPEPWIRDEFTIEPLSSITRQIFLG